MKAVIEPQLGPVSQLQEGPQMYGILQEVRSNPELYEPLFVKDASGMFNVSPDEFLMDVIVLYSDSQLKRHAEEDTFKYFCDVVDYLFHAGKLLHICILSNKTYSKLKIHFGLKILEKRGYN